MLIGLIVSVMYATMNVVILDYNSSIVDNSDYTLSKVESVDASETLHLSDGVEVGSSDVKGYIKVKQGSGTWYDKNNGYMIVEVLTSEIIYFYTVLILYVIALSIALKGKFGFFENTIFRRCGMGIVVLAVCFSVLVFFLYVL